MFATARQSQSLETGTLQSNRDILSPSLDLGCVTARLHRMMLDFRRLEMVWVWGLEIKVSGFGVWVSGAWVEDSTSRSCRYSVLFRKS